MRYTLFVVLTLLFAAHAFARRGEPNVLATGYYAVDSEDDAPEPWKVRYSFVDTTYQPSSWIRIQSGPNQRRTRAGNYYFWRPDQAGNPNMDTTNDCLAGPIPIGFAFNFFGKNYDSITISSNGYIGFLGSALGYALQTTPAGKLPMYAERNDAADFNAYPSYGPKAIIAAAFADLDLITGHDSTKVFVRQSPAHDTFYVSFYNVRIRPSAPNYILAGWGNDKLYLERLQIVLTRDDYGVTINYGSFLGALRSLPIASSARMFQRNATIGVLNESATQYTSFLAGTHLMNGRYDATANTTCGTCNGWLPDSGGYAIRFKRWRNIVRAKSVDMPTRNFELCLGNSLQPQATFQNVDLNQHSFSIAARFTNATTGATLYGHTDTLLGLIRQQTRTTTATNFPIYSTSPNILAQLGTMKVAVFATGTDAFGRDLGDTWPFDDTVRTTFFGIRTTATPFTDASDNYAVTAHGAVADATKWVSLGASVVDGNDATFDPPPPRYEEGRGVGVDSMLDPVVKLDRFDANGLAYIGANVGDTLTSMPLNITGQTKATLSFDYERTGKMDFPLYWDGAVLYGPENTIVYANGKVARVGDSLIVELKDPTQPACNPSANAWRPVYAIDGGNDMEFKHVSITLDKLKVGSQSYFTNSFRFRIRLKANDNGAGLPDDDGDPFFIDNLYLAVPRLPEIEVTWARVVTPYTKMPQTQMTQLPVYVHLKNIGAPVGIGFPVTVQISDPSGKRVYSASTTLGTIAANADTTLAMPPWDASKMTTAGLYRVRAFIASNYDEQPENNTTYSDFYLPLAGPGEPDEFAYDDGANDMPTTPMVDLSASAAGGASIVFYQPGRGVGFNQLSGSFAMKFETNTTDTIEGIRLFFANGKQSDDPIGLCILRGSPNNCIPLPDTIARASILDVRKGQLFDQYWPYYFAQPVVLPPGTYWVVASQRGLNNYFLGGTRKRGGARITLTDPQVPVMQLSNSSAFGTSLQPGENTGSLACRFAMETIAGANLYWAPLVLDTGYYPSTYPAAFENYLQWGTYICNPCQNGWTGPTYWNYAGTYFPMIRAMFLPPLRLPVEMLYFHAHQDNGRVLLTWATAEEHNNRGFIVERRRYDDLDGRFENIGFVSGSGSTSNANGYSFTDGNVDEGTYVYRLRQIDLDGGEHVSSTAEVTIMSQPGLSLEILQPISSTVQPSIRVHSEEEMLAQLLLYDVTGRVVRTLFAAEMQAGVTTIRFNGRDDQGNPLPSGTYLVRLTTGGISLSKKLIVIR